MRKERHTTRRERKEREENQTTRGNDKQRLKMKSDRTCRLTSFHAMTLQDCELIIRLRFEGWIGATMLVESSQGLFQDAPSQLAYLRVAMESGTDRFPRRTGLCVLFHTHQLLIISGGPWTEWWSTRWVHWIWLKDSRWWRCWCFGIGSQRDRRSARRNGHMRCSYVTMSIIGFSVMNRSRC